jgi:predicted metalloprotease with PDZ domain
MKYKVSVTDADAHFIEIEWKIAKPGDVTELQLPAWRPGRYELQNYAKNIRRFRITDGNGNQVPFRKITKDRWRVESRGANELTVTYEYYANQPDAGASYVSKDLLYINPVNCFMYAVGREHERAEVVADIPAETTVACQMRVSGHVLQAETFDHLADSPFFASPLLEHETLKVGNNTIHFWFHGSHTLPLDQLRADTEAYTRAQVKMFGEMPCTDYHFLYLMLPFRFHHGVEHADSTVIAMGQGADQPDAEFYDEFLSISSHEMLHLWNVKRIRPADMLPYDFTKENYSTLGYVYEGVTTYYGDLLLLRSGAWSLEQFAEKFSVQLQKHFSNEGRNNYSVAESSFDTWLDGYVPGVAGRKVSIYVEGMLAAVIADILILHHSGGKHSFDDVLRAMYDEYKQGRGYTEESYLMLLEKFSGVSFSQYRDEVLWGRGKLAGHLEHALELAGCAIEVVNGKYRLRVPVGAGNKLFQLWTGERN